MPSTGLPDLDRLLGGGYPSKSAILVEGPPGTRKEALLYHFIVSGLSEGDACLYVTRQATSEILQDISGFGLKMPERPVQWLAGQADQLRSDPNYLASLSYNIKEALKTNANRRIRVAVDVFSSILMLNEQESVYRFLSQLLAEIKRYDAVLLATLEGGMHKPEVVAAMKQLYDGVIEISLPDEARHAPSRLRVTRMRGVSKQFDMKWEWGPVGAPQGQGQPERRLSAIMFTDLKGFTALGQTNEELALSVVDEQARLIRPVLSSHGGREIKTIGDSFMVEFQSALEATKCASDIQKAVRDYNIPLPPERGIHLRIGIHLGDVVESAGDIMGDAVNIASRIEALADDGGVCLTRQVYDQVQNKFDLPLMSMGYRPLKNVYAPVEVYKVIFPWEKKRAATWLNAKRVAVLPFAIIGPDAREEYFADGMTEEVTASVSRMEGLQVVSRTSVMQYKGTQKKVGDIARELGVGTILEGSVQKAGDRMRITVQLIDATRDEHKWAQSWDRGIEDIFAVQDEIAKKISSSLKVHLVGTGRLTTRASKEDAARAYDLYLKAWHLMQETAETADPRTLGYLQAALKLDPSSALINNGIAWYYYLNAEMSIPPEKAWPKVREFAGKALVLNSGLSEAHLSLALTAAQHDWDWSTAEKEYKEAIRLNPSNTGALWEYGYFLMFPLGYFEKAEPYLTKGEELDPWHLETKGAHAWQLFMTRRYPEAEAKILEQREIGGNEWLSAMLMARVYLETSRPEKALEETKKLEEHSGYSFRLGHAGYLYGVLGKRDDAQRVLKKLLAPPEGSPLVLALGLVHLGLGEDPAAIECFRRACEERSYAVMFTYQLPEFQRLKSEPGFGAIEEKVGVTAYLATKPR